MRLFVGWDVGGWHCDRNRESRDALVVLTLGRDGQPTLAGRAWRGSLRSTLTSHKGFDLVRAMLRHCDVSLEGAEAIMIAIDAPLGWPRAMLDLANGGDLTNVSDRDFENPYTRRQTELDLIRQGFAPLSNVRDMIGSQSTKAIHFLRAADLAPQPRARWCAGSVTTIETYPAVALKNAGCSARHGQLMDTLLSRQSITKPALPDVRDALACAVVAYSASEHPETVVEPPVGYPPLEGWIIVPGSA
ncbi:hypothetical protein [Brevundimonas diminuta]|uniref:hypothetical protein n=1 Tax=Brevundimonas diminuta TaxID=293 RepID=UPI003F7D44BE